MTKTVPPKGPRKIVVFLCEATECVRESANQATPMSHCEVLLEQKRDLRPLTRVGGTRHGFEPECHPHLPQRTQSHSAASVASCVPGPEWGLHRVVYLVYDLSLFSCGKP